MVKILDFLNDLNKTLERKILSLYSLSAFDEEVAPADWSSIFWTNFRWCESTVLGFLINFLKCNFLFGLHILDKRSNTFSDSRKKSAAVFLP
ncbi:hypothetical protein CEXT_151101 [Caerostris extrusa]|uniref:ATP synthase F0 subunit 8 n=1 Tax=Caerostris extrusa TaxID=172846 RepID=A0AAV4TKF8_CAEEX|nr:hypothetical protein CEXT_151101 [Caerostris extrusa]